MPALVIQIVPLPLFHLIQRLAAARIVRRQIRPSAFEDWRNGNDYGGIFVSTVITGVVTNGVVVPDSALPEGAHVEIHMAADEVQGANPLLHSSVHLDPNDPVEQVRKRCPRADLRQKI